MEQSSENIEHIRKRLENLEEEGGPYNQEELKNFLNSLSKIAKEVHSEGLFSKNEDFTEIKAEDIKYLLVPYYQADVIQKFMENRDSKLDLALKFYDEFFKILDNYNYFPKDKKDLYNILRKNKDDENDEENRDSKLDLALKFYDEFFKILDNYNYFPKDKKDLYNILRKKKDDENDEENREGKKPSFELLSQNRDEKIKAYKYKKALSDKIKVIYILKNQFLIFLKKKKF